MRRKMDNGKLAGVLFVVFLRVINATEYFILSNKLPTYGVNNKEFNWFKHYLFHNQQIIQYNDTTSGQQSLYCSVPQESIFVPLSCLLYFKGIENFMMYYDILKDIIMFSDDTEFCASGSG